MLSKNFEATEERLSVSLFPLYDEAFIFNRSTSLNVLRLAVAMRINSSRMESWTSENSSMGNECACLMVSRIKHEETESSKVRHLDILSARCSIDKSLSDFILERKTFCASNASLASWKDSSLASFEQDASKRMASMMADNMDMCLLSPKYDMRKLEVQDRLRFTINRLFAADIIMFILSISDFV